MNVGKRSYLILRYTQSVIVLILLFENEERVLVLLLQECSHRIKHDDPLEVLVVNLKFGTRQVELPDDFLDLFNRHLLAHARQTCRQILHS